MYSIEIRRTGTLEERPAVFINAKSVVSHIRPLWPREESWRETSRAFFVDSRNRLIGQFHVGTGCENSVGVGVKEICAAALGCLAAGVVLVHNHPSGNPMPSQADIKATDRLRKALSVLDMQLLDHIILGEKTFFSFTEEVAAKYPKA